VGIRSLPGVDDCWLGEGLEEIGERAFIECSSLRDIIIPNAVSKIKDDTYSQCCNLTNVRLGEGLRYIGEGAFRECTSLQHIEIPESVTLIHDEAFDACINLTNVVFSDEIEEFVRSESMWGWWNNGLHEKSMLMYHYLVRYSIPEGVSNLRVKIWQDNIHDMLRRVPCVSTCMSLIFRDIDSKLEEYEDLKDAPMLLELAIWKTKITVHFGMNNDDLPSTDMKMQCCTDSVSMVTIIVPNVLPYL
jgi:hypothetical protein